MNGEMMNNKEKIIDERNKIVDEEKVKRVRIKLRLEAEKKRTIPTELIASKLGIIKLDKVLEKFNLQRVKNPRRTKYERFTGVRYRWITLEFPFDVDVDEIIEVLKKDPDIEDAESVKIGFVTNTPNDPTFGWHITTIDAEDAWDQTLGTNIVVAVVDTGVDHNHNDLNNNSEGGDNTRDGNHGTNVVGLCSAETNNNMGISGVGWNAHFLGYDASSSPTNIQSDRAADDINDAVDDGADVINMSFVFNFEISDVKDALEYAFRSGVVCVASAGNANFAIPYTGYPAAYKNYIISVGATNNADQRANFSNYGSWLNVMAPGVCVPTTAPQQVNLATGNLVDQYNNCFSGTSAAAPIVSGIVALLKRVNPTLGPRQVKEILCETTEIPAGTDTSDNRYGKGRVNARKAVLSAKGLWKTVRYNSVPKVGAAVAMSENGWWIVAYSKSVFVGYKNSSWKKMVYYNDVPNAKPAVAINTNGDWIVNYSKSTFVGNRTYSSAKMVYYPMRNTRGAVAINDNGDWVVCYSLSTFVGHKTFSSSKMLYYNNVPGVPGKVAINSNGDWICCYSKSTFVGHKTSSCTKMVYYNNVANTAADVDINDNGDWIVNYSKSTFVGYKQSSCNKMVYYDKRNIPGSVAINANGNWICCYSKSTFVGHKTSSCTKMVYYNNVADAASAVDINDNGDWIVNYSKSTFVGYKQSSSKKMVFYPKRNVAGDVAINQNGDWIAVYSLSTFIGHKISWGSKRVYYNAVPKARGSVDINENGDWIVNYSRTTFVGSGTKSTIKAIKYAPDDMSKSDIEDGYSYPPSSLPNSHGAVSINDAGDWVACYGRSASTGNKDLYTNTNNF